jgi:alginate O-acetyltransferase complex protein AlgI
MISSRWPLAHLWNNAILTFGTGPIGFYLGAAGYFHLMEVLARPAGFRLPPSFNFPIGRENIAEFWTNWNMTATFTFRDYLFYNRWGRQTYNIYFNTLVLFTLVGWWHAANAYWILWGFLNGVLFCSFLIWRKYRNVIEGIPLRGTRISNVTARILTYVCVCLCWYLPSKLLQKASYILP